MGRDTLILRALLAICAHLSRTLPHGAESLNNIAADLKKELDK